MTSAAQNRLERCLELLEKEGIRFGKMERRLIDDKVNRFTEDGFAANESQLGAINEKLGEFMDEYDRVLGQIEKKIHIKEFEELPRRREAETKAVIQDYEAKYGDGQKPMEFYKESEWADGKVHWQGAAIHPSSLERGGWRVTYFDERGFSSHAEMKTKEEAVREALDMGFKEARPGLLDEAQKDPKFIESMEEVERIQREHEERMRKGEIVEEGEGYTTRLVKRGNVEKTNKYKIELTDDATEALDVARAEVEAGEPGRRARREGFQAGEEGEWYGIPSTYPTFMRDKYTRKEVLGAIDKAKQGAQLGIKQAAIIKDALDYIKKKKEADEAQVTMEGLKNETGDTEDSIRQAAANTFENVAKEIAEREGKTVEEVIREFEAVEEFFGPGLPKQLGLRAGMFEEPPGPPKALMKPETLMDGIKKSIDDMRDRALKNSRHMSVGEQIKTWARKTHEPEDVFWIKEGDYKAIQDFIREVEDVLRAKAQPGEEAQKYSEFIHELKNYAFKEGKEIRPDPKTDFNDQSEGIWQSADDFRRVIGKVDAAAGWPEIRKIVTTDIGKNSVGVLFKEEMPSATVRELMKPFKSEEGYNGYSMGGLIEVDGKYHGGLNLEIHGIPEKRIREIFNRPSGKQAAPKRNRAPAEPEYPKEITDYIDTLKTDAEKDYARNYAEWKLQGEAGEAPDPMDLKIKESNNIIKGVEDALSKIREPLELEREEGTPHERLEELKREGVFFQEEKEHDYIFPEGGIKGGTEGEQEFLFGKPEKKKGEQEEIFDLRPPGEDSQLLPKRYLRITFAEPDGKKKSVFLKDIEETDRFIQGIEVNKKGDAVIPKGHDERMRIIDKEAISRSDEYRMHKGYGTLEALGAKEKKTPTGYADTGGYASNVNAILQMPEIVQLAKALLQGKYPQVKKKLSVRAAAGLFRPYGKGKIELRAEIFRTPGEAEATLAHEIGHLVDYLPDKFLKRGNILGHIAALKRYMKHTLPKPGQEPLTDKDRHRLRRLAKKMVEAENADKWIDEVIIKELPISPEDVLNIWNAVDQAKMINPKMYEYIARLNTAEKKSIVKEAMKGVVASQLKQFAKRIKEKTGKKIKVEITKDMIGKRYAELLNEEIKKREAFSRDEIMDELKVLTRLWKPFDPAMDAKFTKYRYSPVELYADAFSVLVNAPGLLKKTAPKFYEAFFTHLDRRPEVKKEYEKMQELLRTGEARQQTRKVLREGMAKNDDKYFDRLKDVHKFRDKMKRDLIDLNYMIIKKIKDVGERNVPAGENPRFKLEDMRYSGSEAELYVTEVYRKVLDPVEKVGLEWLDLGEYMYHRRVVNERSEIANPEGFTAADSKDAIKDMEKNFTKQQMATIKTAADQYAKIRKEIIISKMKEANIYDAELMKHIEDNEVYAKFDVGEYINDKYGHGSGVHIHQQIGTLKDVSNPATATIMKDISLINGINRIVASRSVIKFMQKHFPNEIKPAETRFIRTKKGGYHEPKEVHNKDIGTIRDMVAGKHKAYYVDSWISEMFQANPIESLGIARVLGKTAQPFRMAFTELNYGFWMFNIHRDVFRAMAALPKANIPKFLPMYMKGIKPAFKSVFGIPDSVVKEMQKGNMLISIADVRGLRPEDKQIERLLKMYHMRPKLWEENVRKPTGQVFNFFSNAGRAFTNVGRALERTTKVGTYLYLQKYFPDMPKEVLGHVVRTRGGSPDFLRLGRAYPIYNNFLLFSNAMKEGYRGDYEALSENPAQFMWKKTKYNYIPKMIQWAGAAGLMGLGIKAIYDGASEYDKTNYIVIPLGMTKNGKSVYWRVPQDETGRLMGGILWKMMNHEKLDMSDWMTGIADYMAGQAPTLNPGLSIPLAIVMYASGHNPYDYFRNRNAIPEQEFVAGGERARKAMAKWLANQAGANLVYRFDTDNIDEIRNDLEKFLNFPFASNLFGRFIKVSNYGIREDIKRAKKELRSKNMNQILDAKDTIAKMVNQEPITPDDIAKLMLKPDIIERNLMVALARRWGNVFMQEFMSAQTTEEKAAVLEIFYLRNYRPEGVSEQPGISGSELLTPQQAIEEKAAREMNKAMRK